MFSLAPADYKLMLTERANDTVITNIAGVLSREVLRAEPGGRLYAESLANMLSVHLLRHYAQCADGRTLEACSVSDDATADAADGEAAVKGASPPRAVAEAALHPRELRARSISERSGRGRSSEPVSCGSGCSSKRSRIARTSI